MTHRSHRLLIAFGIVTIAAPALAGEVLLAALGGAPPLAAISLHLQSMLRSPFARSADAVRLLRLRRRQVVETRADRGAGARRSLMRRLRQSTTA